MITGIIFACMIEEGLCQPMFKRFDTAQQCKLETTELIDNFEDTPGMVFYSLCDPDGEPV